MDLTDAHERQIAADPPTVWSLVADLGSPADRLWPGRPWPPLVFDGPLAPGVTGRHGAVRHRCTAVDVGKLVEFAFTANGIVGHHRFLVRPGVDGGTLLRHELEATARGASLVFWRTVVRPAHGAIIERVLDNAEAISAGTAGIEIAAGRPR